MFILNLFFLVCVTGYDFDMYFDPKLTPPSRCAELRNTWKHRENVSLNLTQQKPQGFTGPRAVKYRVTSSVTVAVSLVVTSGFQNINDCIITY